MRLRVLTVILAAIPCLMLSVAVPFVNSIEPRVLGLPFILAWILGWVVLTPGFIYAIYRLEGRG